MDLSSSAPHSFDLDTNLGFGWWVGTGDGGGRENAEVADAVVSFRAQTSPAFVGVLWVDSASLADPRIAVPLRRSPFLEEQQQQERRVGSGDGGEEEEEEEGEGEGGGGGWERERSYGDGGVGEAEDAFVEGARRRDGPAVARRQQPHTGAARRGAGCLLRPEAPVFRRLHSRRRRPFFRCQYAYVYYALVLLVQFVLF